MVCFIIPTLIRCLRILWLRQGERCIGAHDLGNRLKKMEPFVDLCEISNNEFNELFQEVTN